MKARMSLVTAALLLVAACSPRDETGRASERGEGVDTIVTQRQEMDTAVVTTDTTVDVDVDTNHTGGGTTREDTVKR
jgi:hypothetical protein